MTVLFTTIQPSTLQSFIIFSNVGVNPLTYVFEGSTDGGVTWVALGIQGSILNDIEPSSGSDSSRQTILPAGYSQIRMLGSASGGTVLHFSMTRQASRASGGALPILSL